MAPVAAAGGLAGLGRVRGGEIEHLPQRLPLEMRLVSQDNRPVRENLLPTGPLGGASDGAEHTMLRSRVDNAVLGGETKAVEFGLDGLVAGSTNYSDLLGVQCLPLLNQMAEH